MKQQAYQHCSKINFEVQDLVFLKLKPYKHMPLKQNKKDKKLACKYYGPYKVLWKIGTMDYKLELPPSSWVHLVFHVSYLNKVTGDKILEQTIFSELNEEGKIILEPKKNSETRTKKLFNR